MGSLENRLRKKWQGYGGHKAIKAEQIFYEVFDSLFEDTDLEIVSQPTKFNAVYIDVPLSETEMSEIYVPENKITKHGIKPDCLIRNKATGKEIYVEIKRQDGWVENTMRSAGRGNAHERLCKYFTPGLLRMLREEGNISEDKYPFWIVFQGDITRDICRVREIRFWFGDSQENVTFWRNTSDPSAIIEHFLKYILPLLE